MSSGLFEKKIAIQTLQMILGHLGEGLPFNIWRVDHSRAQSPSRHSVQTRDRRLLAAKNLYVTTSGNFRTPTLLCTMLEMGSDLNHVFRGLPVRESCGSVSMV